MRAFWGLVLAAALAGCTTGASTRDLAPADVVVPEPPIQREPLLEWRSLGLSELVLSPQMATLTVDVPEDTLTVIVNQTLHGGAGYGILLTFEGCVWDRPQSFVGIGQTIGADCGGLTPGASTLQIALRAGALSARIEPVALVCTRGPDTWGCPAPSPIQTQ